MSPDLLVGVELRRVRRQKEQLELARLTLDELPNQLGFVGGVAVGHHENQVRRTCHQSLQKALENRDCDGAVMQHEAEL